MVFYLITAVIGGVAIYYSSSKSYLTAKNDMIQRDLTRVRDSITINEVYYWFLDYWEENPAEVLKPLTPEEEENAATHSYHDMSREEAESYLDSLPPDIQLALAKMEYLSLSATMEYELGEFSYGGLYLMDIRQEHRGFVFCSRSGTEQGQHELGYRWSYSLSAHPAASSFLSGDYSDIQFETSDDKEFGGHNYYIGCMPLRHDGEVRALLCLTYNWESFNEDLIESLRISAIYMLAGMVVIYVLLMILIDRVATKPLSKLMSSVNDFVRTKDGELAAERMHNIHVNNEIGILSENIAELVGRIDHYIKDIHTQESEITDLSDEILISLAHTIDAKDKYTNGHSSRVAIYSAMLAKQLGFSQKEQEKIYNMGLLHDIGKIGIPDEIINKTSELTDEEYALIQSHPVLGYEILSNMKRFPELAQAARWHHENYDGTGYPDRISGADIPFEVRIIAVADSYDAMTSNRSYRKYLPQDVVRAEIDKHSGTQFDPRVARAMLEIIDSDKNYKLHE